MDPQDSAPSDLFLARLTDAMLELAPDSGWTQATLSRAAEKAGLTQGQALSLPMVAVGLWFLWRARPA